MAEYIENRLIEQGLVAVENTIIFTNEGGIAETVIGNTDDWDFNPTTQTITKYMGSSTNIVIPNVIDGIKVKNTPNFSGDNNVFGSSPNTQITTIKISYGIKKINYKTFYNCTSLINITMPSSITSIENSAFSGCTSLVSITLPNSVTTIGNNALGNCTSLVSIILPNSVTSIGSSAFLNCTSLTSITIPNSVTSIGNAAFGCPSLKTITIPNSVTAISNIAFENCNNITIKYSGSAMGFPWGAENATLIN